MLQPCLDESFKTRMLRNDMWRLIPHSHNRHRIRSSGNADQVAVAHDDQVAFLHDARLNQAHFCVIAHQIAVVVGVFQKEGKNFAIERHLGDCCRFVGQCKNGNAAVQAAHPQGG